MVEPVVTSTICVCARPCADKIVKEIASNEAVRDKTIANAPSVGDRTRDLRMSTPSLVSIVRQRMDPKPECWTIPSGLFRKNSCGWQPVQREPGGKSMSTEPVLGLHACWY